VATRTLHRCCGTSTDGEHSRETFVCCMSPHTIAHQLCMQLGYTPAAIAHRVTQLVLPSHVLPCRPAHLT
jgi:hypothetical protein